MEIAQLFGISTEWIAENILRLAVVVLVVGWILSRFLSNRSAELLPRTQRVDETLAPVIAWIVRYGILAVAVVVALGQFGIQTASILAVLGAVGLAVALALQGTLSNLAAGILLIWLRPFSVGEYIDGEGVAGTVLEIGLFSTRLKTYDGIAVFAPNSRLWNARISNFTRMKTRMVEIVIGIAYDADLNHARSVLLETVKDERVLNEPAPKVFVDTLGDSSVTVGTRLWVLSSNWWQAKVDLTERCKLALDAAGIEIPFNKLDVKITDKAIVRAA
jgi:small conductance mechanosensitive channel